MYLMIADTFRIGINPGITVTFERRDVDVRTITCEQVISIVKLSERKEFIQSMEKKWKCLIVKLGSLLNKRGFGHYAGTLL